MPGPIDYNALVQQLQNSLVSPVADKQNPLAQDINPMNSLSEGGRMYGGTASPEITAYHGTSGNWSKFDPSKVSRSAYGEGMHVATDPALANRFADQFSQGGSVMPLTVNPGRVASQEVYKRFAEKYGYDPKQTTKALLDAGYDSVKYQHGTFHSPDQSGKLVQSSPGQDTAYAMLRPGGVKSKITGEAIFGLPLAALLSGALERKEPLPPL